MGFEPTPFRTRTLIWRLRPTRPSQLDEICSPVVLITELHETLDPNTQPVTCNKFLLSNRPLGSYGTPTLPPLHSTQKTKKTYRVAQFRAFRQLRIRPGHGSPDPNNPTQPARKKPDPTRPELRGGWARAVFFDPQQSTGRARAVIFDPKPDPTRKTRPKGQKTRPNPKKTRPDTPAQGARANPTRPGDRYGSGTGRPMRPVTRP